VRRNRVLATAGALGVAATVVFVAADPASATPTNVLVAKSAKDEGGRYTTALVNANLAEGDAKDFFIKVKNVDDESAPFTMVEGIPDGNGYKQRYFRGTKEISDAVKDSGMDFELGAGKSKVFRVKVRRANTSDPIFCSMTDFSQPGTSDVDTSAVSLNDHGCVF
jgi:hypothetical protein